MASKGGSAISGLSNRLDGDAGAAPAPGVATASLPPQAATPCSILLVDDDPLISLATSSLLQDLGHAVVEASSGSHALAILRAGTRVDVVLTDQAMPGMTGTQLASEIRAAWPDLPVMLVTAYAEVPENAILKLPRIDKPFGQDELAAAIANLLRTGPPSS